MPSLPAAAAGGVPSFKAASKAIQSAEDLKAFLAGNTAKEFVGFVLALNAAMAGVCVCVSTRRVHGYMQAH